MGFCGFCPGSLRSDIADLPDELWTLFILNTLKTLPGEDYPFTGDSYMCSFPAARSFEPSAVASLHRQLADETLRPSQTAFRQSFLLEYSNWCRASAPVHLWSQASSASAADTDATGPIGFTSLLSVSAGGRSPSTIPYCGIRSSSSETRLSVFCGVFDGRKALL